MPVISITGRKGGIGKSSICANLAGELMALGRTVAVLDADPQKSLIAWAGLGQGILAGKVESVDTARAERFRTKVEGLARTFDRVLIDTPPGFADPALLASLVADLVLLPVGPSPLDILAVKDALALTHEAQSQRGGGKPIIRFVPSKVQTQTNMGKELPEFLASMGEKVLPTIAHRVAVAEAAGQGLTVGEYAPGSVAHEEFKQLAKAIEKVLR